MKHKPEWYAVQVLTGSEEKVSNKLKEIGMNARVPIRLIQEKRHGNFWLTRKVMFPGYIFVRAIMTTRNYYYIKDMPNVVRLCGTDPGKPVAIPPEQLEMIGYFANDGQDFGISEATKVNGKLKIISGPLQGKETKIKKVDARNRRATITLNLFGKTHNIDVGLIVIKDSEESKQADSISAGAVDEHNNQSSAAINGDGEAMPN